jgi:hypothetical protein
MAASKVSTLSDGPTVAAVFTSALRRKYRAAGWRDCVLLKR